jgi:hypothetical protein
VVAFDKLRCEASQEIIRFSVLDGYFRVGVGSFGGSTLDEVTAHNEEIWAWDAFGLPSNSIAHHRCEQVIVVKSRTSGPMQIRDVQQGGHEEIGRQMLLR